jgi:hypothetical protein
MEVVKSCAIFFLCVFEIQHGSSPSNEFWTMREVFQTDKEGTMAFQKMGSVCTMAQTNKRARHVA